MNEKMVTFTMKLKRLIIIFTVITSFVLLLLVTHYLKINNLLFYATGSKEKTLLNSTWEMSPKEIKRSNNVNLKPAKVTFFNLPDQEKGFGYPAVVSLTKAID